MSKTVLRADPANYVPDPDMRNTEAPGEDIRLGQEHNREVQVLPPGAAPVVQYSIEKMAAEFMASTALSTLQADISAVRRNQELATENLGKFNEVMGAFRDKLIQPLYEELKHLRYNLGDKVGKTTTDLDAIVNRLDAAMKGALRAAGLSDKQILEFREAAGIQPEAPSGQELEAQAAMIEGLKADLAQTREELERIRGVQRNEFRLRVGAENRLERLRESYAPLYVAHLAQHPHVVADAIGPAYQPAHQAPAKGKKKRG